MGRIGSHCGVAPGVLITVSAGSRRPVPEAGLSSLRFRTSPSASKIRIMYFLDSGLFGRLLTAVDHRILPPEIFSQYTAAAQCRSQALGRRARKRSRSNHPPHSGMRRSCGRSGSRDRAMLLVRSFQELLHVDPGYRVEARFQRAVIRKTWSVISR